MSFTVTDHGRMREVSMGLKSANIQFWGLLQTHLEALGTEVAQQLKQASPVGIGRTGGHLAHSFVSSPYARGVDVLTLQAIKLRYVRYGTGIYGAHGTPIVPVEKQAMWWPEAGYPRATVAGQKANDFVTPVLRDVTNYAVDDLMQFAHQIMLLMAGT